MLAEQLVHCHVLRAGHDGIAPHGLPGAPAEEREVVADAHGAVPVEAASIDVPVAAGIVIVAVAQAFAGELEAVGQADVIVFPWG